MDVGKSVDPLTTFFSSFQGRASTRYLFSVKATNELKSKVLKNNTMNGKNLKCYYDQIFDNHFFAKLAV